jgi:1-acyl-sn-glycerol-3-phosphate acyltransferase
VPAVLATWVKVDVQGRENIPERGPLILIANHVDNNDSYAIGRYVPFTLHFLARPAGMHSRVLGRYWRWMAAIPADREGLSQAAALLKAGEVVGIFPDGVITPCLLQAKAGVAALAARAGVPVLPVAVWGTERVRIWPLPRGRRRTIHIRFGCPRTVTRADARGGLQQLADSLMTDVAELLPLPHRGYYAEAVERRRTAQILPGPVPVERNGAGGLHQPAEGSGAGREST